MDSKMSLEETGDTNTIVSEPSQMLEEDPDGGSCVAHKEGSMDVVTDPGEEVVLATQTLPLPVVPIVFSWGRSDFGSLFRQDSIVGEGNEDECDGVFAFNRGSRIFLSIASNVYHSVAVTSTGDVYTCGENYEGQVTGTVNSQGQNGSPMIQYPRPMILETLAHQRVSSIACGLNHTVCITASGCAMSFGGNECGQLGHSSVQGSTGSISFVSPKVVNFDTSHRTTPLIVTKATCGDLFTLFLTTSGEVYGCGSAAYVGQSTPGAPTPSDAVICPAKRVEALIGSHISEICAGAAHCLAVTTSGDLYTWGSNSHYQLGYSTCTTTATTTATSSSARIAADALDTGADAKHQQIPRRVIDVSDIVGVAAGYHHSIAWTSGGIVLGAGANKYGQLAQPTPQVESFIPIELKHKCMMVACGHYHTLALCCSGESTGLDGSGSNGNGGGSSSSSSSSSSTPSATVLYGFGANNNQQITATSTAPLFREPVEISTFSSGWNVSSLLTVAAGGDQSFAIGANPAIISNQLSTAVIGTTTTSAGQSILLTGQSSPSSSSSSSSSSSLTATTASLSGTLLRKQFSTLASKATTSMNASSLLALIEKAQAELEEGFKQHEARQKQQHGNNNNNSNTSLLSASSAEEEATDTPLNSAAARQPFVPNFSDDAMLGIALKTFCELLSSPSLLADSFTIENKSSESAIEQQEVVDASISRLRTSIMIDKNKDILQPIKSSYAPTDLTYEQLIAYEQPTASVTSSSGEPTAVAVKEASTTKTELTPVALNEMPVDMFLQSSPNLDFLGIEKCYVALLNLGKYCDINIITGRLYSAIAQSTAQLTHLYASTSASTIDGGNSNDNSSWNSSSSPASALRVALILWLAPIMASPEITGTILKQLLTLMSPQWRQLCILLQMAPPHILVSRLLQPCKAHFACNLRYHREEFLGAEESIEPFCKAIQWLFLVNRVARFAPPDVFYSEKITTLPDTLLASDFLRWRSETFASPERRAQSKDKNNFYLARYGFLLSAEVKKRIIMCETAIRQNHAQSESVRMAIFGGMMGGMAGMNGPIAIEPYFVLSVEREHLLQHALIHIDSASDADLRKPLKVVFISEEGIDEGGVRKEFFLLLIKQFFSPEYGLFVTAPNGRVSWFNTGNVWSSHEYKLIGTLLGLAVYNDVLLDVHFPEVFFKKLIPTMEVKLADVESIDPELHQGLRQLKDFQPAEQVEDIFCRSFVQEFEVFGDKQEKELLVGGKAIAVTGGNRLAYVHYMVQWLLNDSVNDQFKSLQEGFSRVISPGSLVLFSPHELELLMVGTPHLDFNELQQNSEYVGEAGWNETHSTIVGFWKTVQSLTLEEKQKFLAFVTGSNKAPMGGLKNIKLKIQRMGPHSNSLPTAHTCFNTLLLPEYNSESYTKDRLLKAICECEGFGLK